MRRWAWPLLVVGAVVALVIALSVTYLVGGRAQVAEPSDVAATQDSGAGAVKVSWSADSDATSFLLSRDGQVVYSGAEREYTDVSALAPTGSANVEYSVRAVDDQGRVSSPGPVATVEVGPGWGLLAQPAQQLAELLPATPDGEGWNGMRCETRLDAIPPEEGAGGGGSGEQFIKGGFRCALEVDGTQYDLWTDFYVSPEALDSRMAEIREWTDVSSTTWQGGRALVGQPAGDPKWMGLNLDSHPDIYIELAAIDARTTVDDLTELANSLPVLN